MVFMHRHEALSADMFEKIAKARRVLCVVLFLITYFIYSSIYSWNGHIQIEVLTDKDCSEDEVLK